MATFVLLHGAWQGAWCWRHVVPRLEADGHRVVAPDLPGHGAGADAASLADLTLQHYVDAVVGLVEPIDEPVILVGHSMGVLISAIGDEVPDSIESLVYVASAIPPDGSPMLQVMEHYDPGFPASLVWAADRRTAEITATGAREFLYTLSPTADVEFALPRLTPEPVVPFATPVTTRPERYGRVRRCYIETLRDRTVPHALQKSIQERVGFNRVFTIDSDHSPFFSAPDELAHCLKAIAWASQ
jgi:pimeloyl-ACP methyl ester carboxylesterase